MFGPVSTINLVNIIWKDLIIKVFLRKPRFSQNNYVKIIVCITIIVSTSLTMNKTRYYCLLHMNE